jgi:uncharacterized protein (TIGR02453 family)
MAFRGIPPAALEFYQRLELDNTKMFWEANREVFRTEVRAPIEELTTELADYGPFHMFRPHNDLRFARDRPPYKTQQGAYGESEGGAGFYFQLSADGLMAASGYYALAKDQLQRFRGAVDADHTGAEIAAIVDALEAERYSISAIDQLKTAPRGYPRDHPRIELLRRKGLTMSKDFGAPKWLHTRAVISRIRGVWEAAAELNAWLDTHVGPSELEPEGFFGG